MSFEKSQADLVMTKGRLVLIESKSTGNYTNSHRKLRPRIGHLIAIGLLLTGCFLVPSQVLVIASMLTAVSMMGVAFVFLVQMPVRMYLSDKYQQRLQSRKEADSPSHSKKWDTEIPLENNWPKRSPG